MKPAISRSNVEVAPSAKLRAKLRVAGSVLIRPSGEKLNVCAADVLKFVLDAIMIELSSVTATAAVVFAIADVLSSSPAATFVVAVDVIRVFPAA